MTQRDPSERRSCPRIEAAASVLAVAPRGFVGSYLVRNLSLGGALIIGGAALARQKTVKLLFQLPCRLPIGLNAEIVRHDIADSGEHLFGVAFRDLGKNELKAIQEIGLEVLAKKGNPPMVLLACGSVEAKKKIEQELRFLGLGTAEAKTPMQMVSFLQETDKWFEVVIVDEVFGRQDGIGALRFLGNEYPEIFRILLSSGKCQASQVNADAVLAAPWKDEQLQEILARNYFNERTDLRRGLL